jgi:hypothetical protein
MDRIRVLAGMLACTLTMSLFAAEQAGSFDTLDDMTVSGVQERQRRAARPLTVVNPDVITVRRKGDVGVRIRLRNAVEVLRFRRDSAARHAVEIPDYVELRSDQLVSRSGREIRNVSFRIATDIDEPGELPALIDFGPHTSLLNTDHVRVLDINASTLTSLANAIDVQTRRCVESMDLADRGEEYPNRFVLIGDRFRDCTEALKNREGDLFFAEDVPARARQDLHEIYDTLSNRFARLLGSEPALMFVAWRPSSESGLRFVPNWGRGTVILLEGSVWERGLTPQLRNELQENFSLEQLRRRIAWEDGVSEFVGSAMDYLTLLTRSDHDQDLSQQLAAALPDWIAGCRRDEETRRRFGHDCGMLLQFVYDAVARAQSKGQETVLDTWRRLLAESFRRGQSGVKAAAFLASSSESRRIVNGFASGSADWGAFARDLSAVGVELRMTPGEYAVVTEVASLANFRD